jgi:hypothetical protein
LSAYDENIIVTAAQPALGRRGCFGLVQLSLGSAAEGQFVAYHRDSTDRQAFRGTRESPSPHSTQARSLPRTNALRLLAAGSQSRERPQFIRCAAGYVRSRFGVLARVEPGVRLFLSAGEHVLALHDPSLMTRVLIVFICD